MSDKSKPVSKHFKAQIVPIKWGKNKGRFGWVVTTPGTLYRSSKTFATRDLAAFDAVHEHKLTLA